MTTFELFYLQIKQNRWYWLFSIFCRFVLAFAFIAAGMVKIVGERFASGLSILHPMGAYLEALHHTGYYYTFIGICQVVAAILLLIPRTVLLGALLYFPIILNICLLSFAVRFEGSLITAPLMVLANLYLLAWNYDRLRYILPYKKFTEFPVIEASRKYNSKFPMLFFIGVTTVVALIIVFARFGFEVMPRNSMQDCKKQFENTKMEGKGYEFCECIHIDGASLQQCLRNFQTG